MLSNRQQNCLDKSLGSSASMYESSNSQFFTVTTGIQSGPDAFDESPSWELWKYTVSDWFKKEK